MENSVRVLLFAENMEKELIREYGNKLYDYRKKNVVKTRNTLDTLDILMIFLLLTVSQKQSPGGVL